jgi:uncharacterized protein
VTAHFGGDAQATGSDAPRNEEGAAGPAAAAVAAGNAAITRIVLRPLATPLPLGFLGLFLSTMLLAGLQLGWVPVSQQTVLAIGILVFTVPVQFIACIYGFLVRDLVAGTGMGLLAGSWGAMGVVLLLSHPGSRSAGLAWLLVLGGFTLVVPAAAALQTKLLAGAVNVMTAVRFWVTAVYEWGAPHAWETAAGVVGVALAVLAVYAALAFEVEDQRRETVFPTFRRGAGTLAMTGSLSDQVSRAHHEAGVRKQL